MASFLPFKSLVLGLESLVDFFDLCLGFKSLPVCLKKCIGPKHKPHSRLCLFKVLYSACSSQACVISQQETTRYLPLQPGNPGEVGLWTVFPRYGTIFPLCLPRVSPCSSLVPGKSQCQPYVNDSKIFQQGFI